MPKKLTISSFKIHKGAGTLKKKKKHFQIKVLKYKKLYGRSKLKK